MPYLNYYEESAAYCLFKYFPGREPKMVISRNEKKKCKSCLMLDKNKKCEYGYYIRRENKIACAHYIKRNKRKRDLC